LGFDLSRDVTRIAATANAQLQPISAPNWGGRYNFDGYLVSSPTTRSYVQVFRSGSIEAVDAYLLHTELPDHQKQIPSIALEKEVIGAMRRYLKAQDHMAIPMPIFAAITLLRVSNFRMSSYSPFPSPPIDRDRLILPEVLIEGYGADIGRALQPSFDALWQACGLEKSLNYDDEGNWRQHHP
jgi:hypothetical protein